MSLCRCTSVSSRGGEGTSRRRTEGEGDWSMPSGPCSVEATPEAETEKGRAGRFTGQKPSGIYKFPSQTA